MKKNLLIFIWFITIITFTSCTAPDDKSSSIDTNEMNNTHCQLIGLESDLNDFKFISSINNKEFFYQGFCFGGSNIYFSNPHDDQKLYCYNGLKAKKLTDMPVYGLNFLNDSVYFLSNDNIIDIEGIYCPEGYLYRYDLKNGSVNKISNTMMGNIIARENDILFIDDDENNIVSVYSFNPETNEIIKLHSGISTQNIGEYYVISEPLGV